MITKIFTLFTYTFTLITIAFTTIFNLYVSVKVNIFSA